ncbi:MAG: dTMP kinase [Myxococcota bacterium]
MMAGRLVVFEGIDGSGKTTLVRRLAERFREASIPVFVTKEPTDGPHGMQIRRFAAAGVRLPPEEELALFEADRAQHTQTAVLPALDQGHWVLQDRGFHSTAAYQGARGLDPKMILSRSRTFAPEPDVLFWLDVPVELALQRAQARGAMDAFEKADQLRRIATYYGSMPGAIRLDATRPPGAVAEFAWQRLEPSLFPEA